jgi:integrase
MMSTSIQNAATLFFNDFFIENKNTRRAYHQAVQLFVLFLVRGAEYYDLAIGVISEQKRTEFNDISYNLTRDDYDELWRRLENQNARILEHIFWKGDDAFRPPLPKGIKLKVDIQKISLSEFEAQDFGEFMIWMMRAGHVKGKPYSKRSAELRKVAFYKALGYWRFRKLTNVEKSEIEAYVDHSGVQSERTPVPRHEKVPPNFVKRMEAAVLSHKDFPMPDESTVGLSRKEARKQRLDTLRAQSLVCSLADSGMRVSDAVSLRVMDFEKFDPGQEFAYRSQKTGALGRVMFRQETIDILASYLDERGDESPYLFIQHGRNASKPKKDTRSTYQERTRGYGAAISEQTASRIILDVAAAAGFIEFETRASSDNQTYKVRKHHNDFVSAHAFRHARAQKMLDAGVPASVVAQVLGHESTKTTEDIYGNRSSSEVIKAAYSKSSDND